MSVRSSKQMSPHAPMAVVCRTTVGVIRSLDHYVAVCMQNEPIRIGPRLRNVLGREGGSGGPWGKRKQRAYFVLLNFEDLGLSNHVYIKERPKWSPLYSLQKRWSERRVVLYETIVRRAKLLGLDRPTFAEALEGRLCFGRIGIPGTELHFMMPYVPFVHERGQSEMGICSLVSPIDDVYEECFDLDQAREFVHETDVVHHFLFIAKSYKQLAPLLARRKRLQPRRERRDEREKEKQKRMEELQRLNEAAEEAVKKERRGQAEVKSAEAQSKTEVIH